ncbi:acyl-CoA thioesterase [Patulibacter defluvii]|uniref:acyl-CoA thioesterase n=1 Tax=Patulibacter defluvii TaxID=3095358 RepID=UPI002A764436|nr:thioesterase family protein [Patulibacter sp. DM4]
MTDWSLRVRYHECDPQGVVFNAHYMAWADMGSMELWREGFGGYEQLVEAGWEAVVVAAELRFLRPARFDEQLAATTLVQAVGRTSFALDTTFARDGERLAAVRVRYVFVGADLATPTPPPDDVRAGLLARMAAPGDDPFAR